MRAFSMQSQLRNILLIVCSTIQVGCDIDAEHSVLTQHNDNRRTGAYLHETVLTPANIESFKPGHQGRFGRLCSRKVDAQVATQPLYVKNVRMGRTFLQLVPKTKNLLIVATRNNSIYAFDADITDPNAPNQGMAWPSKVRLTAFDDTKHPMDAEPIPGMDDNYGAIDPSYGAIGFCHQTHGPVGITSTPVVDPVHQVLYVVFRVGYKLTDPSHGTLNGTHHFLAAIDLATGQELKRTEITYDGFEARAHVNRPALLLMDNKLWIAFGSAACDNPAFHGWVFAYTAFNEQRETPDLSLIDAYNTSPLFGGAGIWQSGAGLAGDSQRQTAYAFTGNDEAPCKIAQLETGRQFPPLPSDAPPQVCPFGPLPPEGQPHGNDRYDPSRRDLGESILKFHLNPQGKIDRNQNQVVDHFTAGNWFRLDTGHTTPFDSKVDDFVDGDSDLGSGGPLILSNGYVVGGGKQGRIYVIDPGPPGLKQTDAGVTLQAKQAFQGFFNSRHGQFGDMCPPYAPSPGRSNCTSERVKGKDLGNHNCTIQVDDYDIDQAYGPNIHGGLVLWERHSSFIWGRSEPDYLYGMAEKDYLRMFAIESGTVAECPMKTTRGQRPPALDASIAFVGNDIRSPEGMPGAAISLSANGSQDGILWVSLAPHTDAVYTIQPGVLMAFDATNLNLLWDDYDPNTYFAKFVPPTIADGKVFRATFGEKDGQTQCADFTKKGTTRTNVFDKAGAIVQRDMDWEEWPSCGSVVFYGLQDQKIKAQNLP